MKSLLPFLAVVALAACSREPEAPRVAVTDAVVTVPAVPGGMGAAYFTIESNREGARLVSITSPSIRSIELHETREEGGRTRMAPLPADGASFGPGAPLQFEPGGKHAMLMGVDPSVRVGGKVTLTFRVEPMTDPITVEAAVRGPGQAHGGH
jgi:periplasmic copper chaperone A